MPLRHLAIVMPAYNEADGLPGFLEEILENVTSLAETVNVVVVNDRSTDDTAAVLKSIAQRNPQLMVLLAPDNRGHGPTALAAYRAGLALEPDAIVHVDGDGQFLGKDFPRLIGALFEDHVDVVHGVRQGRTDPWFRRVLTGAVGLLVMFAAGRVVPDVNTPFRAYRPEALRRLLTIVPEDALVPHVHFSLAEKRLGLTVKYARVRSLPRRGITESGTMWGEQKAPSKLLPPRRLREFATAAAAELWNVSLRPSSPAKAAAKS